MFTSPNDDMKIFADNLWEYFKPMLTERLEHNIGWFRAVVTANPGGGKLTIQRPFDEPFTVKCVTSMAGAQAGTNVLVFTFGDNLGTNAVVMGDADAHNIGGGGGGGSVTAIPVGQGEYEEPLIQIANGGTGARTAADAILSLSVYPVGSIYMSVNPTDPSLLFGGTWERIQDTFLLAAGSTYTAGDIGGEATHTLTISEMPAHYHFERYPSSTSYVGMLVNNYNTGGSIQGVQPSFGTRRDNIADPGVRVATDTTGDGSSHNNMPPYIAVYVWKRVS